MIELMGLILALVIIAVGVCGVDDDEFCEPRELGPLERACAIAAGVSIIALVVSYRHVVTCAPSCAPGQLPGWLDAAARSAFTASIVFLSMGLIVYAVVRGQSGEGRAPAATVRFARRAISSLFLLAAGSLAALPWFENRAALALIGGPAFVLAATIAFIAQARAD